MNFSPGNSLMSFLIVSKMWSSLLPFKLNGFGKGGLDAVCRFEAFVISIVLFENVDVVVEGTVLVVVVDVEDENGVVVVIEDEDILIVVVEEVAEVLVVFVVISVVVLKFAKDNLQKIICYNETALVGSTLHYSSYKKKQNILKVVISVFLV